MVILRATKKVLKSLPQTAADGDTSDTALGDWYVNRLTLGRQPLLLLVSEKSRLAILTPARGIKLLPGRLSQLVASRLDRLRVSDACIRAEVRAMENVSVGRTTDRSIVGQMVDFAKAVPYYVPLSESKNDLALQEAEDNLGDTPCRCTALRSQAIWPVQEAVRLLEERWSS